MSAFSTFKRAFIEGLNSSDRLSGGDRGRVIEAVETAFENEPPPTIALLGETGVGKSTTINALFGGGEQVGHARATTPGPVKLGVRPKTLEGTKGVLIVYDMPGVGDDIRTYERHRQLYLTVLADVDVALWVHPAADRMVQLVQTVVADLYESIAEPPGLVFALNKADEVHPRDWNRSANVPSAEQLTTLEERNNDFLERMRHVLADRPANVVAYSALYRFNLTTLFKALMTAFPEKRRWVLRERMDIADFTELVDKGLLQAARELAGEQAEAPTRQPSAGSGRPSTGESPLNAASPKAVDDAPTRIDDELAKLSRDEYDALVADRAAFARWLRSKGL